MARTASARTRKPSTSIWGEWDLPQQELWAVGIMLLAALIFYAPVIVQGLQPLGSDTLQWRASAQAMIAYRDATGEEPLWNPNLFAGMPGYLINYPPLVPQFDTLLGWLRRWTWPLEHVLLLLGGMYVLLRGFRVPALAAALGAMAYGLTTYFPIIQIVGHNSKFIAFAFLPWLLWAFRRLMLRPDLLGMALWAVILALEVRAGHPQVTYYGAVFLALWWAFEAYGALREGRWRPFGAATGLLLAGTALAALMVLQPYWAIFEYNPYSIRGGAEGASGGLRRDYAMAWSQSWGELLTLLVPAAFGEGGHTYWGDKPFTEGPHYLGVLVILLAIGSLVTVRRLPDPAMRRAVYAAAAAGLLAVGFSLGKHFPLLNEPAFAYLPFFNKWRTPEMWLVITALSTALLAGFAGWGMGPQPRAIRPFLYVGAAIFAFGLLLWAFRDAWFAFERPQEARTLLEELARQTGRPTSDPQLVAFVEAEHARQVAERRAKYTADVQRLLLLAGIGLMLLWAAERRLLGLPATWAGLAVLVAFDLGSVGRRHFREDRLVPRGRDLAQAIPVSETDRFIARDPELVRGFSLAQNPFNNAIPSYSYQSLGGYHGAKLRLYQDLIDSVFFAPNPYPEIPLNLSVLRMLNTRYVVLAGEARVPGWREVFREGNWITYRDSLALPRAWLVGQVEVLADLPNIRRRLLDTTWNPARTALLLSPPPGPVVPIRENSTARVEVLQWGPRRMAFRVQTDAPRFLVLSEIWYPAGWRAWVDGKPSPLYRTNYALRGLYVPAGTHEVRLSFDPDSHRWGVRIAAGATVVGYGLLFGLLLRARLRRPRRA
ncbi:MAG: YfhO family protein [Bacteroidota bacterium]|nr:YfhO family protein [Bacteroidota bacterium]MDW8138304.1 YfhO family protein [Bacteroidota bacterium]